MKLSGASLVLLLIVYSLGIVIVEDVSASDGTIYGHVYDADAKQPLSQAFVYCQEVECSKPSTDSKGYYAIENCFSPSKTCAIRCTKHGYNAATKSIITDKSGNAIADFNLEVEGSKPNGNQPPKIIVEAPPSAPKPLKVSEPEETTDVNGLWKVSLAGVQFNLALNQSEDSLFGQATFEGDNPWKGVIAGSISGRQVYIALAAMQGKVLVSTELKGATDGDNIQGSYVRSDSQGRAAKGDMKAERFNLETEG